MVVWGLYDLSLSHPLIPWVVTSSPKGMSRSATLLCGKATSLPQFPEQTLQQLDEDLQSGIFDYLKDYGIEPTLDLALAEFSRTLSPEDLENVVGKITILLTDTRWPEDEFSHLNVYEIQERDLASIKRMRVAALEDKPMRISLVFNEVSDYLDVLQKELKKKYGHSIEK